MSKHIKSREVKEKAYQAFWYLNDKGYIDGLDVSMAKVNPKTEKVDDDDLKNTKIEYWLETGKFNYEEGCFEHDIRLDCGAETFEEAIILLASKVKNL